MASSPIVWTPDKRMILQSAVADLSPEAFQAVVGRVFDVVDAPAVTPERRAELARTANPHDRRRRGGGRGRRRGGRGGRGRGGRDRGGEDRKVASFTG